MQCSPSLPARIVDQLQFSPPVGEYWTVAQLAQELGEDPEHVVGALKVPWRMGIVAYHADDPQGYAIEGDPFRATRFVAEFIRDHEIGKPGGPLKPVGPSGGEKRRFGSYPVETFEDTKGRVYDCLKRPSGEMWLGW